jgi:protein TonB
LASISLSFGQQNQKVDTSIDSSSNEVEIFKVVEKSAVFPGGIAKFYKFIGENLRYPKQAKRARLQGKVYVHFVINSDGSIDDDSVRTLSKEEIDKTGFFNTSEVLFDQECEQEAIRVIRLSPNWIPGMAKNRAVKQRYTLPIQFRY